MNCDQLLETHSNRGQINRWHHLKLFFFVLCKGYFHFTSTLLSANFTMSSWHKFIFCGNDFWLDGYLTTSPVNHLHSFHIKCSTCKKNQTSFHLFCFHRKETRMSLGSQWVCHLIWNIQGGEILQVFITKPTFIVCKLRHYFHYAQHLFHTKEDTFSY